MNILLLDDDKSMLLIMKKMISKIPGIEVVGSFQRAGEAYKFIRGNKVDLVFVDIKMPEENGLDFARRVIAEDEEIVVSFLTSHTEYALEAFEVHAFDYILKPITQARLEKSIQWAEQRFMTSKPVKENPTLFKLSIRCLGGMEAEAEDSGSIHFRSSKSAELLAYLLMKKGRSVSKWSIMEDIFRGMPLQNAETYLNTTVYKLRKALEPHGLKAVIISAEESYKIDLKRVYVDFIDFENRLSSLSDINNSNQEEALRIEKLFAGELFGEKDYHWALPEKERLSEVYLSFAKELARNLLEGNQLTAALQILKKLIYMDGMNEEINCLLMRVYAAHRDKLSLEKQYESYTKLLRRELGIRPEKTVLSTYNSLIKSFDK